MQSIFVSSTFRDMQSERDMLHLDVLPALIERAHAYGESVDFIDLRWGVNTGDLEEEEGAKKVLEVCLDEIERANPYMLIFLGERYGWIPDLSLLTDAAARKEYALCLEPTSVTALEIEFGILSRPENIDRCIFCMREPMNFANIPLEIREDYLAESDEHKSRLETLKARIKALPDANIIFYHADWDHEKNRICGLDSLAEQLTEQFTQMFQKEWETKSKHSKKRHLEREFAYFMEEKRTQFQGRTKLIHDYMSVLTVEKPDIFLLRGEVGSGKSSIMSVLAKELEANGFLVIPFFAGRGKETETVSDLLQFWAGYVEQEYHLIPFDEFWRYYGERPPETMEEVYFNLAECAQENTLPPRQGTPTTQEWRDEALKYYIAALCGMEKRPVVFLADGLDELKEDMLLHNFKFLPDCKGQPVTFILSAETSFVLEEAPEGVDYKEYLVPPADKEEQNEIIQGILHRHHKGMNRIVLQAVLQRQASSNPFYLNLLMTRLMMMDIEDFRAADSKGKGGEGIDRHMLELIEEASEEMEELMHSVMETACKKVDESFCKEVLALLAFSKNGLWVQDLEKIVLKIGVDWNSLSFSRFFLYLRAFFIERADGRIDFSHTLVRDEIQEKSQKLAYYYHFKLVAHFSEDILANYLVRIEEGLYHARKAEDGFFTMLFFDRLSIAGKEENAAELTVAERIVALARLLNEAPESAQRPVEEPYTSWHKMLHKKEEELLAQFFPNRLELRQDAEEAGRILYEYCMEDGGIWLAQKHINRYLTEKVNADRLYCLSHLVYGPLWNKIKYTMKENEVTMFLTVSKALETKLTARYQVDASLVKPLLQLLCRNNQAQWLLHQEKEAYESINKAMQIFDACCNETKERVLLSQLLERMERTASLEEGAAFFLNIVQRRYNIWEGVESQTIIEKREMASARFRVVFYLYHAKVTDDELLFGLCHQALELIQAPLPSQPGEDAFTLSTGEKLFVQEADTAQSMLAGIALELIDNDGLKNKEPETLILASRIYRMIGDLYLRLESQQEAEIANGYATLFEKQASKLMGGDLTCGEY